MKPAFKILSVWTKNEEICETFKENLEIFIKSSWTIDFSSILTKYFRDFCFFSESIYPLKITSVFYRNFSDIVGELGQAFPLP